jgi:hypothetical protein
MKLKLLVASSALTVLTACSTFNSTDNVFTDTGAPPDVSAMKTDNAKLSSISKQSSDLLKETLNVVDNYIQSTEGQTEYRAFVNKAVSMNEDQRADYFKSLKPQQKAQITDTIKTSGILNKLNVTSDLLKQAMALHDELKTGFSDNLLTMINPLDKGSAVVKISNQVSYSMRKLNFLKEQYAIVEQLNSLN